MRRNMVRPRTGPAARIFIVLAFAAATGGAMQAFTASNSVTADKAGDGTATISGYTISSVAYSLNGSNPQNIDAVTFSTSAAATTVKLRLVSSGSTWYSCSTTNSPTNTAWSCGTTSPQATVATADEVRVVAVA